MTDPDPQVVSKGEFARLCRVDPGRVSQWIKEGKLTGAALVGEGRSAKINVAVAHTQLKRRLDPNQMTANGIRTRIPGGPLVPPVEEPPEPPAPRRPVPAPDVTGEPDDDDTGLDLPTERALLTREQRMNWELRNRERRGELIDAAEAERRWSEEIVDLRSRMLAVAGDLPIELPHLTARDIEIIDRMYRHAMDRAAGEGA